MEDGMKNRKGVEFICAYKQGGPYNKALQKRNEAEERVMSHSSEPTPPILTENWPI
jgi:hypothetical protein